MIMGFNICLEIVNLEMKAQAGHARQELLGQRAAINPAALHVSAPGDEVVSLLVECEHLVHLAEVVGRVGHHHENRPTFDLVETGENSSHHASPDRKETV